MLTPDKFDDLETRFVGMKFYTFSEVVSTNETAKRLALNPQNAGVVVVAESQTGGRGRQGKAWYSPPGVGLWFSAIFPADKYEYQYSLVPLMTSLAVAEAIDSLGMKAELKWPNDVLLGGKKVCGILAESVYSGGRISTIVTGVGINVNHMYSDFPPELNQKSTSLRLQRGEPINRTAFLKQTITCLDKRFAQLTAGREAQIIAEWKQRCPFVGQRMTTKQNDVDYAGVFQDIELSGRMLIKIDTGEMIKISAGEINVEENHVPGY